MGLSLVDSRITASSHTVLYTSHVSAHVNVASTMVHANVKHIHNVVMSGKPIGSHVE